METKVDDPMASPANFTKIPGRLLAQIYNGKMLK